MGDAMTEYIHRVLLVVAAADRERANARALEFDPSGGSETFGCPLSATGAEPATHYGCCTSMRGATHASVAAIVAGEFPGGLLLQCSLEDPALSPAAVLAGQGLTPICGPEPG
jgi:hypothetical protein